MYAVIPVTIDFVNLQYTGKSTLLQMWGHFILSNCSVEQISTIIKKPPGTVKSRLFKGRSLIKKRLEEAGYEK
ncbi:hypothetical protein CE91St58_18600 [Lachnospiraceae bacterium]|mgnify:FL=1|nr:hypothetical protein CE91St58_18600 [Lachnospiraceae bacterium]